MMRPLVLFMVAAALTIPANAASAADRLQPCPEPYDASAWNNCFGEAWFPTGQNYVGQFRAGKPHGRGTMSYPGSNRYVGEWRDGKREGQGTMWYPIGHKYVGAWRNNRRNGKGTMTYPDGRKYVGSWRDGKRNGQGVEYSGDGSVLRAGIWKDGMLEQSK